MAKTKTRAEPLTLNQAYNGSFLEPYGCQAAHLPFVNKINNRVIHCCRVRTGPRPKRERGSRLEARVTIPC